MNKEYKIKPEDIWNLNNYLARTIAEGVEGLRDNIHGCPGKLTKDCTVEEGCEKWREILNEIAFGFRQFEEIDEITPELERSFELLQEWWFDLWD